MKSNAINRKLLISAIAVALGGLGVASSASATLLLAATINGVDICAADNNVACTFGTQQTDSNGAVGTLDLGNAVIGGVTVLGSVHVSTLGNPDILDSSSLTVTNNNAIPVTVTVAVGATGFDLANVARTSGSGTFRAGQGGPTIVGNTITMEWWDDNTNGQGAETPTDTPGLRIDTFTDVATVDPFAFAHNGGPFAVSDPGSYSMTETFTFTLAPGGQLISRGQTEVKAFVPEPATLALLGIALVGLGFSRRHKQA